MTANLEEFTGRVSSDDVQRDLNLIHDPCGERICTIEDGDTIAVLARTAAGHICGERPPCPACGSLEADCEPGCVAVPGRI